MRKESVRTPRNESKKMAAKVNPTLKLFSRLKKVNAFCFWIAWPTTAFSIPKGTLFASHFSCR